ncbi:MAG: 30S ribosomal protein S3 [Candidatus Pacebacteria bacterium]|nr:30S ribosomal protein S3 [Candidatus Paceibacterota bacterium]
MEILRKRKIAKPKIAINLNIEEVKRTDISAMVTAQSIAWDLEKRMPYRRTMKKYLESIMQNREVEGAKIKFSGRLDGNEISRREWLAKGKLPMQTLRANIDYGEATAFCTYGAIGIKVWIYKGNII